jgi:hypothetical protein
VYRFPSNPDRVRIHPDARIRYRQFSRVFPVNRRTLPVQQRAVIFYDRVRPLLFLQHAPPPTLLGYVPAHEIAHVLQGVARHSETGVMRAQWRHSDFEQMRIRLPPFTDEDVQLIRQRLALRDAPANLLLTPAAICDSSSSSEGLPRNSFPPLQKREFGRKYRAL